MFGRESKFRICFFIFIVEKKNPVMMCLNSSRVLILYLNKESNDKKQKVE